jgi:LuxR family transcriptional regulator, maltose regulon positive regulatory protein
MHSRPFAAYTGGRTIVGEVIMNNIEAGCTRTAAATDSAQSAERRTDLHERPIRIYALGRLEVVVDHQPLRFERRAPLKPLELLKTLLALGGRAVNPAAVCDTLWPDADGFDAYRSLVTTVYRLRKLLRYHDAVSFSGSRLALESEYCWVDAWAFERDLVDLQDARSIERALLLYRGCFLGADDHPHAFEARDRLQRKFVRSALALGKHYESVGNLDGAIALYERVLDCASASEDVHQRLMDCLARSGRTAAAAEIYQRCRKVLALRLNSAPSRATELAFLSINEALAR